MMQTPPTPLYGLAVLQRPNCGVGQFAGVIACNPGAAYGYWSWAVVSFNFATTYATFAHEVGHVFGAEHEPLRGTSEGLQPRRYAYAHRVPGAVRDLMSGQECVPDTGTTVCTSTVAVQYSNPDKLFAGTSSPSGTYVPVYTADGNRYRNAARIIREFAPDMVGFRGVGEPARIFWDGFE